MNIRIDMFIDKDLRDEAKWGCKVSAVMIAILLSPLLIIAIIDNDMLFGVCIGCFLFIFELMCFLGVITSSKNWFKKILLTPLYIQVQSFQGKLLYEVYVKNIKRVKKIMVEIPHHYRFKRKIECIVLFLGEEELVKEPEYCLYFNDKNFLFIENRPNLEEFLQKHLHIAVEEKD